MFVICTQLLIHAGPILAAPSAGPSVKSEGVFIWQAHVPMVECVCECVFTASLAKNAFPTLLLRHSAREQHNRYQSVIFNL